MYEYGNDMGLDLKTMDRVRLYYQLQRHSLKIKTVDVESLGDRVAIFIGYEGKDHRVRYEDRYQMSHREFSEMFL